MEDRDIHLPSTMARSYKHVFASLSVIIIFVVGSKLMEDGVLHEGINTEVHSSNSRLTNAEVNVESTNRGSDSEQRRKTFPNIKVHPSRNTLPNPYISDRVNLTGYGESVLTFLHNPKSGGTTLKDCMTRLAPKLSGATPLLVTPVNREQLQADFMNGVIAPEEHDLMMGGASFGVCDAFHSKSCSYFTILREPYERMISHYFFCKDGGESSIPCENRTIEEFTVDAGSIFFTQLAWRVSCSCAHENCDDTRSHPWTCSYDNENYNSNLLHKEEYLDYLVQHLSTSFAVIGLTEEYDTTLSILQQTSGLPFHDECSEVRSNRGSYGSKDKHQSDERKLQAKKDMLASKDVYDTLYPDVVLYKRAREIYNMQIRKLSSS